MSQATPRTTLLDAALMIKDPDSRKEMVIEETKRLMDPIYNRHRIISKVVETTNYTYTDLVSYMAERFPPAAEKNNIFLVARMRDIWPLHLGEVPAFLPTPQNGWRSRVPGNFHYTAFTCKDQAVIYYTNGPINPFYPYLTSDGENVSLYDAETGSDYIATMRRLDDALKAETVFVLEDAETLDSWVDLYERSGVENLGYITQAAHAIHSLADLLRRALDEGDGPLAVHFWWAESPRGRECHGTYYSAYIKSKAVVHESVDFSKLVAGNFVVDIASGEVNLCWELNETNL